MPRPLPRAAGAAVMVALVLTVIAVALAPDSAPAALASTSPPDGAMLTQAPTEIELTFTDPVNPDLSHVSVRDGSGASVNAGHHRLAAAQRLRQPVDIVTTADALTVAYHITFVDGTSLTGTLRFSIRTATAVDAVATAGPTATTDDASAETTHRHGIDPVSATLLALDGMVALTVVALLMRRPRIRTD